MESTVVYSENWLMSSHRLYQSLIIGIVPDIRKEAHVFSIPKGGDKIAVPNYRPFSLLSNINKVLERIVFFFSNLYNHFLKSDILTPLQSGFIPVTQLRTNYFSYIMYFVKL